MAKKKSKEIGLNHVGIFILWILSILFILGGFYSLFTAEFTIDYWTSVLTIFIGILILPNLNKILMLKFNFRLSVGLRIILALILYFIFLILRSTSSSY